MKTLILVRHAKSSWKYDLTDHERPLKKRGRNDANLVSRYLKKTALFQPDFIIISTATRAKETAQIFIENLDWQSVETEYKSNMYDFSGESVYNEIISIPNEINTAVLFGHNPTFSILASQLGSEFIDNLPTCGLVQIQFDTNSWKNVNKGLTLNTIKPKDFK